ncbi:MAG: phosphatase PAP2 family protein [Proteobacteria bacterium]|nr:phosphatase PAP2 family protein [Pseudomonadota bacterium]
MFRSRTAAYVAALALTLGLAAASPAAGQSLEGVKRPEGEAKPVGYLPKGSIDYRLLVGPPPAPGSVLDQLDMAVSQRFQTEIAPDRWDVAELDSKMVYPRFADAFGKPIDRARSPRLVALLNRVMRDAADPVWTAKDAFQRPRPYQRYQLARRCGSSPVPAPDREPRGGSSYPSGHTVYGWAAALLLADVAPGRAPLILERGRDYALSRVICGYHFPTDTEAARTVAAAVLTRLHGDDAFLADLRAAQAEYGASPAPVEAAATSPARDIKPVEAQAD